MGIARKIARVTAGLAVAGLVLVSPTVAAAQVGTTHSATVTSASNEQLTSLNAMAGRPHYIAGYTDHARQRMAQRHIHTGQVEHVIHAPNTRERPGRSPGTWRVSDGKVWVVINTNAYIVSVGKE